MSIPTITIILDIIANEEEPYDRVIFMCKGKRTGRNLQCPNRDMVFLHWEFSVNDLSFLKPRFPRIWTLVLIEF